MRNYEVSEHSFTSLCMVQEIYYICNSGSNYTTVEVTVCEDKTRDKTTRDPIF